MIWEPPKTVLLDGYMELPTSPEGSLAALSKNHARVRKVVLEDLAAIAAIEGEAYAFPWSMGNFVDSINAAYDFWALAEGPTLIAYCVVMWLPDEAHLLNITVAPEHQNQGFGRRFLHWVFDDARKRGAQSLMLEVRPSNVGARALYSALGFEQIGLRKSYYPSWNNSREDALVLSKALS
jgi:[ribosomal protein S18]-alanine N-acetyltransferase